MTEQFMTTLGGLGLFLVGMLVMTEGLKAMAGDALHGWLRRFTRSPGTGAITGTFATALLQSSSATTVTTVGFVAAGLLTFPQALGIIFGANLGTTITGWMVALFGFKLKIGAAALPVVFLGSMLRLFGRARWADFGRSLAGFGILFVGMGFMQEGMAGFAEIMTPDSFPPDTWGGRLMLLGLGMLITLVTQSSSAGVAISMTALSVGAINFHQAAAMVIGMDVGTTVTAVIAALGSSDAARRTGFSHTIFNIFTALAALLLIDPYIWALELWDNTLVVRSPELALVGFHTLFNLVALLIGLPLAEPFSRMMSWLVPGRDEGFSARLDKQLLSEPAAATAALEATLDDIFDYSLEWLILRLNHQDIPRGVPMGVVRRDLLHSRDFLDAFNAQGEKGRYHPQIGRAIHALDHLQRLFWRLEQDDRVAGLVDCGELQADMIEFRAICAELRSSLGVGIGVESYQRMTQLAARLWDAAESSRDDAIRSAVAHDLSVAETARIMNAERWLQRVAHHVWRVSAHLGEYDQREASEPRVSPSV